MLEGFVNLVLQIRVVVLSTAVSIFFAELEQVLQWIRNDIQLGIVSYLIPILALSHLLSPIPVSAVVAPTCLRIFLFLTQRVIYLAIHQP